MFCLVKHLSLAIQKSGGKEDEPGACTKTRGAGAGGQPRGRGSGWGDARGTGKEAGKEFQAASAARPYPRSASCCPRLRTRLAALLDPCSRSAERRRMLLLSPDRTAPGSPEPPTPPHPAAIPAGRGAGRAAGEGQGSGPRRGKAPAAETPPSALPSLPCRRGGHGGASGGHTSLSPWAVSC